MTTELQPAPLARADGPAAGPCTLVIFGASGDLTKRKLIPALYNLARHGLLSEDFAVVGFARRASTSEGFRTQLRKDVANFCDCELDPRPWEDRKSTRLNSSH